MSRMFDSLRRASAAVVGALKTAAAGLRKGLLAASAWFGKLKLWAKIVVVQGLVLIIVAVVGLVVLATRPRPDLVQLSIEPPSARAMAPSAQIPPLRISFSASAAAIELVGKDIPGRVKLSPEKDGRWIWSDDRTIAFFPRRDWEPGESYDFTLDPSLFSPYVKLQTLKGSFRAAAFAARLASSEFYIDPTAPDIKRVTASVSFTHPVNAAELEKSVGLPVPFRISYDEYRGTAYIVSDNIAIKDRSYEIELLVKSGYHSALGGNPESQALSCRFVIPGRYDYAAVQSTELGLLRGEDYGYKSVLVAHTNLGVKPDNILRAMEVLLLPKDRPAAPGMEEAKDFWWVWEYIDDNILAASTPLELTEVPSDQPYPKTLTFTYEAPSRRYVVIRLKQDIEALGGFIIKAGYKSCLLVPEVPKQLGVMSEGSLLSMSGEKKIPLYANDLEAVQFEIGRIIPDQVNNLITQIGSDFQSLSSGGQDRYGYGNSRFGIENVAEISTVNRTLAKLQPGEIQYFSFDFGSYLGRTDARLRNGLFFFRVSEYDPAGGTTTNLTASRLILVTDLGALVKKNVSGGYDLFVQSIHSGRPVGDAEVQVVGKNGLPIVSSTTGWDGHVSIPALDSFRREKTPEAFVIRKGEDLSFLPLKATSSFLNYSRFDTGGVRGASDPGFIDAYLFSDRGIYRPGDAINFGIIVKAGEWSKDLTGLPLQLGLEDPRGLEIQNRKLSLSASGFETYSCSTLNASQTGQYTLKLYLARDNEVRKLLGSTTVKVEEFQPDRLSVRSYFLGDTDKAWVAPEDLTAVVSVMNLYGTPAVGNPVSATISLSPAAIRLSRFPDYRFYDPLGTANSYEEPLADAVTDQGGEARFSIDLDRFGKTSFMVRFSADAMEKMGGRGVETVSALQVSPLSSIVGFKADGSLSYIYKDAERRVQLVAVNPDQDTVELSGLTLDISERRYVSVLEKGPDGLFRYKSVEKVVSLVRTAYALAADGSTLKLPTEAPGDFTVTLTDAEGTRLASFTYSVAGSGNLARSLDKNAELQLLLDSADYDAGELVRLNIKAPYTGAGLITIERDKVYAWKWFTAETASTTESIRIPENMEGSAYVNVSFIRSIDSREIYTSPLSYGVVPLSINKAKRANPITIRAEPEMLSGTPLRISYSSEKPGKIVVFAVDEGILQVARYVTPDPNRHFFAKRALEVSTSQILDLILPEFSIVQELSAMGGGADGELTRNLNPFKRKNKPPVVYWSGILASDSTERSVIYDVPDYFNGSLRIMAVCVSPGSIGAQEEQTTVRSNFVLSPNVPPVVTPGDTFQVGVGVMNDLRGSTGATDVRVECAATEQFEILGAGSLTTSIERKKDAVVYFDVRVKEMLGSGSLTFTASAGTESSRMEEGVSIRPALPYRTELTSGKLVSADVKVPLTREMYPEFRSIQAMASYLPLGMSYGLRKFLDAYPYGCTEQIVSRAFPVLALKGVEELGVTDAEVRSSLAATQEVLRYRQNLDGSIGLWAANAYVSGFVTAYAMHYLTDAEEAGYPVDQVLLERGLSNLEHVVAKAAGTGYYNEGILSAAYAIYVLTRNGKITTGLINSLTASISSDAWRETPTALYVAGAYAIMKNELDAANLLMEAFSAAWREEYWYTYYNQLSESSLALYMASRHLPQLAGRIGEKALEAIVSSVSNRDYNTISASYAVMGLSSYVASSESYALGRLHVYREKVKDTLEELALSSGTVHAAEIPYPSVAVKISNGSENPVYYQVVESGFDTSPPQEAENHGLEAFREYTTVDGGPAGSPSLGSEVRVHVKIRTTPSRLVEHVAIVDLLPTGFELVYDRAGTQSIGSGNLPVEFVEPREDRVLIFCTASSDLREFVYTIRPVSKGTFTVPPVYAEAMYDKKIWTRHPAEGFITVKD